MGKLETVRQLRRAYKNWIEVALDLERGKEMVEVKLRDGRSYQVKSGARWI